MKKRRATVAANKAASGIAEENTDADDILDDLILETDEMEESKRVEADTLRQREEQLLESGNNIRDFALRRRGSVDDEVVDLDDVSVRGSDGTPSRTPSSSRKRRRRTLEEDSDEDLQNTLKEDFVLRQKCEEEKVELKRQQLQLDRERLAAEKGRLADEKERFLKLFQTNERRLEIEQRRLDIDALERRGAAAERSKVVDVLSLLAEQLRKK